VTRRRLAALGWALLITGTAGAAAPQVDALFPSGGRRGETVESATLIGKVSDWPVEAWSSHPALRVQAGEKKQSVKISIGRDVPTGPHLLRFFTAAGASEARVFEVGDQPEVVEAAANDSPEQAEAIEALPVLVNGRLERGGDTDFYSVRLRAGQLFTARLEGYSLGSLIDPFLVLLDDRGYEVAVASDTHNLDPFLQHRVDRDGEYRVQVFAIAHKASTSVSYAGSSAAVYRLRLTTAEDERIGLPLESDVAESAGAALKSPVRLAGLLARPGERDEFTFPAVKGETYTVRVEARRWHYLWDPVLTLHRPDGKLLRQVDDTRTDADAEYTFKAAVDGDHRISIEDRFRTGGAEHRYRLVIGPAVPSVAVTVDKDRWELKPGGTVDLKLKVDRRDGHKAALSVRVENLPEGITADLKEVEGKAKTATLKLKASAETAPFNGAIRVMLSEEKEEPFPATWSFATGDSRGDYLVNETADLWLTVPAVKPPSPPAKKDKE
jgi:hypothetical protein